MPDNDYAAIFPPCRCMFRRGFGGGRCDYCRGIIPFDPTWDGIVPGSSIEAIIAIARNKGRRIPKTKETTCQK